MDVARVVRACRRRAGLTQGELAQRLGVHRVTLARWEAGRATMSAEHLADALAACGQRLVVAPLASPARRKPVEGDEPPASGPEPAITLDPHDLTLLEAQLARSPEQRLHTSQELARLRASAAG